MQANVTPLRKGAIAPPELAVNPLVNLDAEEAILGGIMLDPDALPRILQELPSDAFYSPSHQTIYAAARALHLGSRPCSLMAIASYLHDHDQLKQCGGQPRLAELMERAIGAANIDFLATLILDKWQRRRLEEVGAEIRAIARDTAAPLEEVIGKAEAKVFGISQVSKPSQPTALVDLARETFAEMELRSTGECDPGVPCSFYDLDAMTQGFQRSDLIIIAARPAMGKTAFALNVAKNMGATGYPVLVCSLEMAKKQLHYRLLSAESSIESGRLRSGRLDAHQWETVCTSNSHLAALPVKIDDVPNPSVADIRSKALQTKSAYGDLGAIAIDYLQLMGGVSDNRVQELSKITRSLKCLARELNVPILALSQLSRGVESRTNKRPMMSDLRDSGSIEQDADLIITLYRDEYYNPDSPDRGIAEVSIIKHRNGPTGTIKLLFEPQFNRFRNLARGAS